MTKYKRLTLEEREQIFSLVNQGKSNREIATSLNRAHTTIAKELKRCGTNKVTLEEIKLVGAIET